MLQFLDSVFETQKCMYNQAEAKTIWEITFHNQGNSLQRYVHDEIDFIVSYLDIGSYVVWWRYSLIIHYLFVPSSNRISIWPWTKKPFKWQVITAVYLPTAMLLPILLLSCIIPQTVLSGQIPVIDGVIGGVRTAQKATDHTKPTFLQSLAVTPGKLR